MDRLQAELLDKPSVKGSKCAVCGEPASNNHHVIVKGMGGSKLEKRIPTIILCGFGNASQCHGKAHHGLLHFRWRGGWEFLELRKPAKYYQALEMDGWERIRHE